MIAILLFVFAPFKFIKDEKAKVNIFTYFKYLGVTILEIVKILANIVKQAVLTLVYLVKQLFTKDSPEK